MPKRKKPRKAKSRKGKKEKAFKAVITGENVSANSQEAFDLYSKGCFGGISDNKIIYSFIEALYLLEKGRISVYEGKKRLNYNNFLEKARKLESNFWPKFCVYRDIRNRGYIIKTALKFGAEFRVYDRGVKPGQEHAKWILFPVYETSTLTWHDFAAKNRVAHSTKKNLLIAIVDEEGDITYYEIKWLRP